MSKSDTVGSHKTAIYQTEQHMTAVRYHQTEVVQFDQNLIVLHSGGWQSVTTKLRMNQTSNQFGLGFSVYQKNFEWFVDYNGQKLEFYDGMIITRTNPSDAFAESCAS